MELLERGTYLDELEGLLYQAMSRHGQMVFLGGEAGVGKSALVRHFLDSLGPDCQTLIGYCDPISTPGPLGPLLDFGRTTGGALEPAIQASAPRIELFRAFLHDLDDSNVSVVVFEDAHWADESTLDLLRYLGRRIASLPALVVVTYRDDEVSQAHPLRHVLGDLATARAVRRLSLKPLSLGAVQQLAKSSSFDGDELFRMTGGNPFVVTELLAQGDQGLPESVRDAVLVRCSRLTPDGKAAIELAAVIGTPIESRLLAALALDFDAKAELVDSRMLVSDGFDFTFRHELVRQAVLDSLAPGRRRALNRQVLTTLQRDSSADVARLAHHAAEAGDAAAVLEFAAAAARRAASLKSHRESAAQFERALSFADRAPDEVRAQLLDEFAHECYLTDRIDECIEATASECSIWESVGNTTRTGDAQRRLARALWTAGRGREALETAHQSIGTLNTLPPGPELAMACSTLSQLLMLSGDFAESIEWGERAIELSEPGGQIGTLVHALNNVGSARMRSHDDEGVHDLLRSLELARAHDLEDHVARAYVNLAWSYVERYEFGDARTFLQDGLEYTDEHGLESMHLSLRAMEAIVLMYRGEWDEAKSAARSVLASFDRAALSRMLALCVLGRMDARQGNPDADRALEQAFELCQQMSEFQRLGYVRAARAEAAWLAGDPKLTIELTDGQVEIASERRNRWLAGEFAYWRWLAGAPPIPAVDVFEPFALQIAGRARDAANLWRLHGCPYEAADALTGSDDESDLRYAHAEFVRLGAAPAAAIALRRLRDLGAERIPRGPRPRTQANPFQLTSREMEVLALLVQGRRTQDIADTLFLSPRTVGHHITAILAKLDVHTRDEAVRKAVQLGIVAHPAHPSIPLEPSSQ